MATRARKPRYEVERVFSLVTTLAGSGGRLTRADLEKRLADFYGTSETRRGKNAIRRKFERDKGLARKLGIPIKDWDEGDGYELDREAFPALEVKLDEEQRILLLALAGALVDDPVFPLREDLATAVHKCLMASGTQDEDASVCRAILDADPGPGRREARKRLDRLVEAVQQRRTIRFTYRDYRANRSRRQVDPYGLVNVKGRWKVVGRCHDRDAIRVFVVNRMDSLSVARARRVPFRVPEGFDARREAASPQWRYAVHEPVDVVLEVDADFAWRAGSLLEANPVRQKGGASVFELRATNVEPVVRMALRYGPRVRVVAPEELVDQVVMNVGQVGTRKGWSTGGAGIVAQPVRARGIVATGTSRRGAGRPMPEMLLKYGFLVAYLARHPRTKVRTLGRVTGMTEPEVIEALERIAICGVYPCTDHRLFDVMVFPGSGEVIYEGGPAPEMEQPVQLTEREAVALTLGADMLARSAAERVVRGAAARRAARKAAREMSESLLEDLRRGLSAAGEGLHDVGVFETVYAATLAGEKLRIDYWTESRDEQLARTIHPYVVFTVAGTWYVSGWCELRKDVRTFRIDRIREARTPGVKFRRPAEFDPRWHITRGVYPHPDPLEDERVVVELDPGWVAGMRDRPGMDFLDFAEADAVSFAVPEASRDAFLGWMMSRTTRFRVREPKDLQRRLVERRREMLAAYGR